MMTYDGATMRLYLDGLEVGSTAKTGAISSNSTVSVWIGTNPPSATSRPWDGAIDEGRVYNRSLTPSEIQTLASGSATTGNILSFKAIAGGGLLFGSAAPSSGKRPTSFFVNPPRKNPDKEMPTE